MKKQLITLLLALGLSCACVGLASCGDDDNSSDNDTTTQQPDDGTTDDGDNSTYEEIVGVLSYTLINDGTAYEVSGIDTRQATKVIIPTTYNGLPVTSIGGEVFYGCDNLTSVTILDSVTNIGYEAFRGCSNLTSVHYTGTIDQWAMIDFDNSFSNPLYYAGHLYINGEEVTEVNLTTATYISDYAFRDCSNLTSVTIGNSVTNIGDEAFYHCYKLIEVINKSSLTMVVGSEDNGYVAYYAKQVLTETPTVSNFIEKDDYIFYNDNETYYLMGYTGKETDLVLPDGINGHSYATYQYAFYYCNNLTSVTIGNGVTSIGEWAFYSCDNLTSVTIENGVTSIERYAFCSCDNLTSVTIGNGVTSIGACAFGYCNNLTSITILDSVTSIGNGAFMSCANLTSVTIPDSVTSIGESAFYYCPNLTSVTIGNNVTSIGDDAFDYCYKLIEVINKSSLTMVVGSEDNGYVAYYAKRVITDEKDSNIIKQDDYIFYNDKGSYYLMGYTGRETDLVLPDGINGHSYAIYQYAFYNCANLASVMIPNSVTSIGSYAFNNCDNLTSITIPDSVTSIGARAFWDCFNLTSVTIGNGVTSIRESAFYYCPNLTSVTLGNNVTSIGKEAFYFCDKLIEVVNKSSLTIQVGSSGNGYVAYYAKRVITDEKDSNIIKQDDYIFYNDSSSYYLMGYTGRETDLVLPENINGNSYAIYQYAFYYCDNLTSITIPDSVTSIGGAAFGYCSNLTSITIPDSVTSIGANAFRDCDNLTSVTIGNSVTSIGFFAFVDCDGLTSVTIGNGVTSIGNDAFYGCANLTSVYYTGTIDQWAMIDFANYDSNPWNRAKHLYINGEEVTEVNLTTATYINDYAFYNCDNLTSVTIGNGVTSIGKWAFYYCGNLTSVTIPDSVTSIGDYAFSGCDKLTSVTFENTSGWYVSTSSTATSGTSVTVTNPSTNATYLRSTYRNYYWKRSE